MIATAMMSTCAKTPQPPLAGAGGAACVGVVSPIAYRASNGLKADELLLSDTTWVGIFRTNPGCNAAVGSVRPFASAMRYQRFASPK